MCEIVRCKRCNRILTAKESIERGYGLHCYTLMLAERIKKNELDISFIKTQLKHRTMINTQNIESIERIKQDLHRPERDPFKVEFNIVVKELKIVFQDGFNYKDYLKPIEVRETPEEPPVIESLELIRT